ncbi:adenylate/guanylate cyclase domain-containing protein [Zooshikella sp. RANM57]|uniref:adenylate/guanylate cyclase domain-containing protein n=1 Tax=Zooshikella sp. RANM57 TaxID=3425863 RepID=UPI003D6E02DB
MLKKAKNVNVWPDPIIEWAVTSTIDVNHPVIWIKTLIKNLLSTGLPLSRIRILHQILHPQLAGISYCWTHPSQDIVINKPTQGLLERETYLSSPLYLICEGNTEKVRCRLNQVQSQPDYPILNDLRKEGMTDYLVLPLKFSEERTGAISFATTHSDGFSDEEVSYLQQFVRAITRSLEVLVLHEKALSLLNAYLGKTTGNRVLAGTIQRGDGETINAVIWFSDLRASTKLSETLPSNEYLNVLNQYFDCLAGSVLQQEGEVLRFIGDAVLAIFPVGEHNFKTWDSACNAALVAVKEADRQVTALNQARKQVNLSPINYGIALHIGEVHYGNIGTATRVEFTVVGKAANEAAKIESLCKVLNKKVLISESFTQYLQAPWRSLGEHALPGSHQTIKLYSFDFH